MKLTGGKLPKFPKPFSKSNTNSDKANVFTQEPSDKANPLTQTLSDKANTPIQASIDNANALTQTSSEPKDTYVGVKVGDMVYGNRGEFIYNKTRPTYKLLNIEVDKRESDLNPGQPDDWYLNKLYTLDGEVNKDVKYPNVELPPVVIVNGDPIEEFKIDGKKIVKIEEDQGNSVYDNVIGYKLEFPGRAKYTLDNETTGEGKFKVKDYGFQREYTVTIEPSDKPTTGGKRKSINKKMKKSKKVNRKRNKQTRKHNRRGRLIMQAFDAF